MKRCSYCGAKNKATFEYCIRCSEPLVDGAPEGVVASDQAAVSRLFFGGVAAVVLFAVAALILRAFAGEPEAPQPPAPAAAAGARDMAPRQAPITPEIDSQEVLGNFNAGLAAFNERDYSTAVGLFQEVIAEIPENPSAHQYLGLCFFHLQQYPEAMDALMDARALRPDSFELLDHYVTAAKKAGDLASGAAALRDYIQR
ncbi:MAG: tetratricopeptide repeat protein, partial [Vicinamibacteria bacterium]